MKSKGIDHQVKKQTLKKMVFQKLKFKCMLDHSNA